MKFKGTILFLIYMAVAFVLSMFFPSNLGNNMAILSLVFIVVLVITKNHNHKEKK